MMRRMQILSVFAVGDSNRYFDVVNESRMPEPRGRENHQCLVLRAGLVQIGRTASSILTRMRTIVSSPPTR